MNILNPLLLFMASAVALAFAYSALPSQRWWTRPLPVFPAQVTAALAALVALRGWVEVLGAVQGGLAWLSTLAVPLIVLVSRPLNRRGDRCQHRKLPAA